MLPLSLPIPSARARVSVKFRAVIFDMDGVIADSEPLYAEAINVVLRCTGHVLTELDHAAIMGSSISETWGWVHRRFALSGEPAD